MIPFRSIYLDSAISERILDIFDAPEKSRDTALFFVHGGGWSGGARKNFHPIALAYRDLGFECASTDYRLAPGKILQQITDIQDSLRFFADDLARRGRARNIALIGSSAGAHLALMAALLPPLNTPNCPISAIAVQATPFIFEPWLDIFPAIWTAMQNAAGKPYTKDPALYRHLSPSSHFNSATPPIFALHAENEHMFPLQLTEEAATAARKLGLIFEYKIYPRTEHGFFYSLDRWQQKEAFQDILDFITRHSHPHAPPQ